MPASVSVSRLKNSPWYPGAEILLLCLWRSVKTGWAASRWALPVLTFTGPGKCRDILGQQSSLQVASSWWAAWEQALPTLVSHASVLATSSVDCLLPDAFLFPLWLLVDRVHAPCLNFLLFPLEMGVIFLGSRCPPACFPYVSYK